MDAIIEGKHPKKPRNMSYEMKKLWEICERCWERDPSKRLKIQVATKVLSDINSTSFDDGSCECPFEVVFKGRLINCVKQFWDHASSKVHKLHWDHARKSTPFGRQRTTCK